MNAAVLSKVQDKVQDKGSTNDQQRLEVFQHNFHAVK